MDKEKSNALSSGSNTHKVCQKRRASYTFTSLEAKFKELNGINFFSKSKYTKKELVCKDSTGAWYRVVHKLKPNKIFLMKKLEIQDTSDRLKCFLESIILLNRIDHPKLLKFHGLDAESWPKTVSDGEQGYTFFVFMEDAADNLDNVLNKNTNYFSDADQILKLIEDILSTGSYLQQNKFILGDVNSNDDTDNNQVIPKSKIFVKIDDDSKEIYKFCGLEFIKSIEELPLPKQEDLIKSNTLILGKMLVSIINRNNENILWFAQKILTQGKILRKNEELLKAKIEKILTILKSMTENSNNSEKATACFDLLVLYFNDKKEPKQEEITPNKSTLANEDAFSIKSTVPTTMKKITRTKIACTVAANVTYEELQTMCKAGMNIIRVNMAYCDEKALEKISTYRNELEKEFDCYIPIMMDLRGTIMRMGSFEPAYGPSLRKGQEFRISTNSRIIGDKNIVGCDCSGLGSLVEPGDKIVVNYGRIRLTVKKIEKEHEALDKLRQIYPDEYSNGFTLRESEKEDIPSKEESDIILCTIDTDCNIGSDKPFFVLKKDMHTDDSPKKEFVPENNRDNRPFEKIGESTDHKILTDFNDLQAADKHDVDFVVISEVQNANDIKLVKNSIEDNTKFRLIAKIQNSEALRNFDSILQEVEGIVISRGYLTGYTSVEKLFFTQKEIIRKCHEACKPVIVMDQILESMTISIIPTTSEINDISNMIIDNVDVLALVDESTFGKYKQESIEILSRICREIETQETIAFNNIIRETENLDEALYDPFVLRNQLVTYKTKNNLIQDTIVSCTIKASYDLDASLIICFTQRGTTALKLSKSRSKCPIIAVSSSIQIARKCSLYPYVKSIKVGSMYYTDELIKRVLIKAQNENWIKEKDYVIVSYGQIEGVPGTTNTFKILQIPKQLLHE